MLFFSLLIVILVIVMFLPIHFFVAFKDGKLKAGCSFLLFYFSFNDQQNKNTKKNKRKESSRENKEDSRALVKGVKYYKNIVIILAAFVKNIFRCMYKFKLNMTVSAPDSASVALCYGRICTAVMLLTKCIFGDKIKSKSINIKPDFSGKAEHGIAVDCSFSINLVNIVKCLIKLVFDFLRKGIFTNERKTT